MNTHAHSAAGNPRLNNPKRQISVSLPQVFNLDPTLTTMSSLVKELNGIGNKTNNVFAETWSESLAQSFHELDEASTIIQNPAYKVNDFQTNPSNLDRPFQAVARYIKSRQSRNVDREVYVIEDGGYDMHQCNCVGTKFTTIDATLRAFRTEMINQGLWNNVVIVTGSDFGRVSIRCMLLRCWIGTLWVVARSQLFSPCFQSDSYSEQWWWDRSCLGWSLLHDGRRCEGEANNGIISRFDRHLPSQD